MTDYASTGVNLQAAAAATKRIAAAAKSTVTERTVSEIGHFGGLFALDSAPDGDVLVASTDGVGTKVLLGQQLGLIDGLGQDLIHHCINDILVCGASPLFFLDYMAFGKLNPDVAGRLAESMAAACRDHGIPLLGGETAEMPGVYEEEHFDLAGTIVGIVKRDKILDGKRVQAGDVLIGLPSNGPHTNGYSLIRKIFKQEIDDRTLLSEKLNSGESLAEALMQPHRCYLNVVRDLLDSHAVHALAHITGGGLIDNTMRVIPDGLKLDVDWNARRRPELFRVIQERGNVAEEEMRRVFNLGVGLVMVVESDRVEEVASRVSAFFEPFILGRVAA